MQPLRIAVAGLGIGRRHIRAYQALPGVEVVAIADVDPQALAKARDEFAIPFASTDYEQVIARADVDAISICTPDRLHAGQAIEALEAGKHVLCEKPLATTLQDAAGVVRKVKETGRKLAVGHNYRFIPQFAHLKELADAGDLGDPFYAESSYVQDLYSMEGLGPGYWRLKDPQDFYLGGAIHNVDLLRWVLGEVEEVHSYSSHVMPFYSLDDNYISNLRFCSGRIGRVLLLLGARLRNKFHVDLAVYGPQGSLKATMQRDELLRNCGRADDASPEVLPIARADSHALEIAHFVDCIRQGRQPLVDVVEGARGIAVCEAAIRSAREGRPVPVDYSSLGL